MTIDAEVKGSMERSVRNAKAMFGKIEKGFLRCFIQSQDGIRERGFIIAIMRIEIT
jgi:hypothetical protein